MVIIFGLLEMNIQKKQNQTIQRSVSYADESQARNLANAAIDITIAKLEVDPTFRNKSNPWQVSLDDGAADVLIEDVNTDTLKLTSHSSYGGEEASVIVWLQQYKKSSIPDIMAAFGIYNNNFSYTGNGTYAIDGNDHNPDDTTGSALPGMIVPDDASKDVVLADKNKDNIYGAGGTPSVDVNDLDFSPYTDLINTLANSPLTKYIPSGNYKGELGTAKNPGVFFIDNYVKLSGGLPEGYGILVVRSNGDLDLSGALDINGNFIFHGLVIFEDGWKFGGAGTPVIDGAVLVGSNEPDHYIDIGITGTVDINYDSKSIEYARMAADQIIKPGAVFKILKVYE
jgi:hypothetical protein